MEDYPIPNAIVEYNDQSVETDKNVFSLLIWIIKPKMKVNIFH